MRFLIISLILMSASLSQAEVQGFNEMIKEASISEKILRKRLLRILNSSEVAIAANDKAQEQLQNSPSRENFEVRLVRVNQ
ncbi:hypothetical protein ACES2J_03010 [Bdellovibrio bacteriovorus]|uniref:hypothetical protein n=1 Tax=Bdellovibrio bacteriovorus TaxID=959 RepID=UPI0035A5F72D